MFIKILLLGDSGVGKTSIINTLTRIKDIYINNIVIKLQIWEFAGSEESDSRHTQYLSTFNCILFVYDVSNHESFKNVEDLFLRTSSQLPQDACKILVGNKNDLFVNVSYEEGRSLADKLEILFFETSASLGYNIYQVFHRCVREHVAKLYSYGLKINHS